ncbi:MAG: helix-turn-helix domain-containing protein [Chloroflexota bacterium]
MRLSNSGVVIIMTVRDVAEYLRLSEAKVYRLANLGQIPCMRIGKTWRFRKDLLDHWIEQGATTHLRDTGELVDPEKLETPDDI